MEPSRKSILLASNFSGIAFSSAFVFIEREVSPLSNACCAAFNFLRIFPDKYSSAVTYRSVFGILNIMPCRSSMIFSLSKPVSFDIKSRSTVPFVSSAEIETARASTEVATSVTLCSALMVRLLKISALPMYSPFSL